MYQLIKVMIKKVTIFIFFLFMNSCGKEQEERIVYSKYFQDVIESKCHYLKGTNIKQGKCVEFNRQGDTIGVFQYVNNKLNGRQIYFHKNNGVRKIVNYRNDLVEGVAKNFFINGLINYEVEFKKGLLWDINFIKDINGNILDQGDFKEGNGLVNVYYKNGNLKNQGLFKNGRAVGKWLYITDTGAKDTVVYNKGVDKYGIEVIFY